MFRIEITVNLTLAKDVRNKKNCKGIEILLTIIKKKKKKRTMYQKINLKN